MINLLAINILLAIAWAAFSDMFTLSGLVIGYGLGFIALWLTRPLYAPTTYFTQVIGIGQLLFYFLWDLLLSSVRVLWDVVRPVSQSRPGIVGVPVAGMTDFQKFLLANLISLTPGTLSLEISDDGDTLYVHCMFMDEGPEAVRQGIEDNQKRLIRRAVGEENDNAWS